MQKLFVYADFDWLDKPLLIGELSCDSVRGNEIYGFPLTMNGLQSMEIYFSVMIYKIIRERNTHALNETYSHASLTLCLTAGDAHC